MGTKGRANELNTFWLPPQTFSHLPPPGHPHITPQPPITSCNTHLSAPPAYSTLKPTTDIPHPPVLTPHHSQPGEERAGEAQTEEGCGTGPHQPSCAEGMFQPALWSSPAPLQPEPTPSESASALENILPVPSAQKRTSCCTGGLQAGGTDLSDHEGHGKTGPGTPQTAGVPITRPPAVCISAPCWGG